MLPLYQPEDDCHPMGSLVKLLCLRYFVGMPSKEVAKKFKK